MRKFYNGVSVLDADGVIKPPQSLPTTVEISKLSIVIKGNRIDDYMVVYMVLIYVRGDDKSMSSFGESLGQLAA